MKTSEPIRLMGRSPEIHAAELELNSSPKRRYADKIRLIADEAWERGYKELSTELHELARKAEKIREDEYARNNKHAI